MEFKIANEFAIGQMVKIPAKVDEKSIEASTCGWNYEMRLDLGKVGVVKFVDDDDILVQCPDNDNSWYWPKSIFVKPATQAQPWHEVALHLADFTYSDGSKISWRAIAEMVGVPRTTVSDFLRKTLKGA